MLLITFLDDYIPSTSLTALRGYIISNAITHGTTNSFTISENNVSVHNGICLILLIYYKYRAKLNCAQVI